MTVCIACNALLSDTELMMSLPSGDPENMCHVCRGAAFAVESEYDYEYMHQHLTEIEFFINNPNQSHNND